MTPAVSEIPSTLAGRIRNFRWANAPVIPGAVRPPIGSQPRLSANTTMQTMPKKNCGIETPIIPATVSRLSPSEPFFSALRMPRTLPSMVEMKSAASESSSVAGKSWASRSLIATPLVIEYPKLPCKSCQSHFR